MGKLLCEKKLRDVWCRNESVRAEIGQILHTHTHAAKLVVEIAQSIVKINCRFATMDAVKMDSRQKDVWHKF